MNAPRRMWFVSATSSRYHLSNPVYDSTESGSVAVIIERNAICVYTVLFIFVNVIIISNRPSPRLDSISQLCKNAG